MAKARIEFCQIESISECKHTSHMEDFLDFRLSTKMHIKLNFFMGFLSKYTAMCMSILLLYCEIFMSVAWIVVEIFAFLHGPLLWLILYKFLSIPSVWRELSSDKVNILKFCQAIQMIFVLNCRVSDSYMVHYCG